MKFTLDITDPASLKGITLAREAKNAVLTPLRSEPDQDGKTTELPIEDHPDYIATDAGYVQMVMEGAAKSYAKQFGVTDEAIAEMEAKLAEMKARAGK